MLQVFFIGFTSLLEHKHFKILAQISDHEVYYPHNPKSETDFSIAVRPIESMRFKSLLSERNTKTPLMQAIQVYVYIESHDMAIRNVHTSDFRNQNVLQNASSLLAF